METRLRARLVTAPEVQHEMDAIWERLRVSPAVGEAVGGQAAEHLVTAPNPFLATPGEEALDMATLILIAAAGKLAAAIPERVLLRIFDDHVWPALERRLGRGIERDPGAG